MNLTQHPLSAAFPAIPEEDFKILVQDILVRGLIQPIVTLDGMILDGWCRFLACKEAGKRPKFAGYKGKDPKAFVRSMNLNRRHLTGSQRARAIIVMEAWRPVGGDGSNQHQKSNPAPGAGLSEKDLAEKADVGERTIRQAKKAERNGTTKLNEAVTQGNISVKEAAAISDLPPAEQDERVDAKARGEKPPKKPETQIEYRKCQNRDRCDLVQEHAELIEHCADLEDICKTEQALMQTDPAKEMMKLRESLRICTTRRNELMTESKEKTAQITYWKGQAVKLGWKPKKK